MFEVVVAVAVEEAVAEEEEVVEMVVEAEVDLAAVVVQDMTQTTRASTCLMPHSGTLLMLSGQLC